MESQVPTWARANPSALVGGARMEILRHFGVVMVLMDIAQVEVLDNYIDVRTLDPPLSKRHSLDDAKR